MGSEKLPLRNIGIYHNLPDYDSSITDQHVIITGANGISGFGTMRALLDAPQRWTKIYALSRRPPPEQMMKLLTAEQRSRVQHVACDFLESGEKIAQALKDANVKADYIFFYSYLQPKPPKGAAAWSNAEELVKVNVALLKNFLDALPLAGIKPKRFLLQTGAKNYGVHIGRARTPAVESDPQPQHLEPNFYYPQEDALHKYCEANGVDWNIVMPAWILGAVNNAQMNALHPFSVYSAVQAHKGEPLAFFGDWNAWQDLSFHSTARLTGYLSEWAVLEEKCKNQRFNSTDSGPFSWDRFYHELTRWFGVEKGVVPPTEDDSKYQEMTGRSGKDTPLGYGPPTKIRASGTFTAWAQDPKNSQAWADIMKQSGGHLTHNPFDDVEANFTFADYAFLPMMLCPNKARLLGWTGFVDTIESVFEMYHEMETLGMVPRMKVEKPRPLA
ncbi:hypothetical protein LTS08_003186 [Lithohypha guttulata]|nr:hypothetical protein LTS08_003186 [Lithohypha guttulata]